MNLNVMGCVDIQTHSPEIKSFIIMCRANFVFNGMSLTIHKIIKVPVTGDIFGLTVRCNLTSLFK